MIILRMFRKERNKCINQLHFLLKYIFKTAGKVEVQGREKLPEGGPYVVACTHTSFMDVLMLATGMYPTQIHYMAKKKNYLKGNSKIGSLKM